MTLENKLLQKLAETQPVGERHELTITDGVWSAHLNFERRDELSGRLWEVRLVRQTAATGDLSSWANRVAARVAGLMESLKVVEVDDVQQQALLRSVAPTVKDQDLFFFEVQLRGTTQATIHRYQGSQQPGKRREQIAFALTHETLAKLVADVTSEK